MTGRLGEGGKGDGGAGEEEAGGGALEPGAAGLPEGEDDGQVGGGEGGEGEEVEDEKVQPEQVHVPVQGVASQRWLRDQKELHKRCCNEGREVRRETVWLESVVLSSSHAREYSQKRLALKPRAKAAMRERLARLRST